MRNARDSRDHRGDGDDREQSKLRGKKHLLQILVVCVAMAVLVLVVAQRGHPPGPPPPAAPQEGIDIDSIFEWNPAYITVYYPRTENEQVDRAVRAFVDEKIAGFRQGARPGATGRGNGGDELTVSLKVTRFDDDIVSFLFRSYAHYAGEPHGRSGIDTMTFNLATGEMYDLASLFRRQADDYLPALSDLAFDGLRDLAFYRGSALESALLRQGTAASAENFTRFALDGDTLRLLFPPTQIGSGVNAADRCDIPLGSLRNMLTWRFLSPRRGGAAFTQPELDLAELEGRKLIALTFDDGPHPEFTPPLLDILRGEGIRATFFVLGCNVEETPEILLRAAAEGHQIGNHTFHHKNLTTLGPERRRAEINSGAALIESLSGRRPSLMRPPYGEYNRTMQDEADAPLVLWSVDPWDWSIRDTDEIYRHVMERAQDGDIILLHDCYPETVAAAEKLIPALKAQGFVFVTVDQLLAVRGEAEAGEIVRKRPVEQSTPS